jgi:hypothetical protein
MPQFQTITQTENEKRTLTIREGITIISLNITGSIKSYHITKNITSRKTFIIIELEEEDFIDVYEIPLSSLGVTSSDELIKALKTRPEDYYMKITGENRVIDEVVVIEDK